MACSSRRDFWKEVQRGIRDGFAAGPEAIPDQLTDGQKGKVGGGTG